ncbi:uncharacterized protein LOC115893155 [Rhinopithecus roxellana]|uniref:uncharacterized protein LOC115893155 n=1 Tax=Rhinopithecus roxellana TaxID=61622 RepID=UPI0012375F02|nr:uncharacterized protein LOC115893155 [Rhinopithecus roxellana]
MSSLCSRARICLKTTTTTTKISFEIRPCHGGVFGGCSPLHSKHAWEATLPKAFGQSSVNTASQGEEKNLRLILSRDNLPLGYFLTQWTPGRSKCGLWLQYCTESTGTEARPWPGQLRGPTT